MVGARCGDTRDPGASEVSELVSKLWIVQGRWLECVACLSGLSHCLCGYFVQQMISIRGKATATLGDDKG